MKVGLVLGGAASVWADAADVIHLCRPTAIVAVNDIGARWAGPVDIWCTLHPEKMQAWRAARARQDFGPAKQHIGCDPSPFIDCVEDYRWPGMNASGSSGLYAVKLLMDRGFQKVVLAGVPMDAAYGHFFDPAEWGEVSSFWQVWIEQLPRLKDKVKSMSGRTRELLGAPDMHWLRAA